MSRTQSKSCAQLKGGLDLSIDSQLQPAMLMEGGLAFHWQVHLTRTRPRQHDIDASDSSNIVMVIVLQSWVALRTWQSPALDVEDADQRYCMGSHEIHRQLPTMPAQHSLLGPAPQTRDALTCM